MTLVERAGLWTDERRTATREAERRMQAGEMSVVRLAFADQHGVLRGKTVLAQEAPALMTSGVTMTTTLLAKDTAHKTAYPVFTPGGGFGMAEMEGAADFIMVVMIPSIVKLFLPPNRRVR